jgi:ribonuclease BN (tRNA processing enzyme)
MPDELLVLGSGSAAPTRYRFASAYALIVTGKLFLIDCGAPVSTLLYRYGLDPTEVQTVFLSHWHVDHVANLGLLLGQNHQHKRVKTLRIYGPKGTRGKVKRLLADSFLTPESLSYKLDLTNVDPGQTYQEALLQVTYFKTKHLEQTALKAQFGAKAIACGMALSGPGWRIVYSGDSASPEELAPYAQDCTLLIHELAHHTPQAIAQFAAQANIPNVLISHIGLTYDESSQEIATAFAEHYQGNLFIAEDGTRLRLNQLGQKSQIETRPAEPLNAAAPTSQQPASASKQLSAEQGQEAAFLQALRDELNLPGHIGQEVLHRARKLLAGQRAVPVKVGQIRLEVARRDAPLSRPLTAADKVQVTLTLDAGADDAEVKSREGVAGLRRGKIIRLTTEAIEQNGVLTQTDLAGVLNGDVRTIRRDIQALQSEGHTICTRGQPNSAKGEPYQTRLIKLWLDHQNYEQIAHWLHHSSGAVANQVQQFLRVVLLHREDMPGEEIAEVVGLPASLTQDFLDLYQTALATPHQRNRLNSALAQELSRKVIRQQNLD